MKIKNKDIERLTIFNYVNMMKSTSSNVNYLYQSFLKKMYFSLSPYKAEVEAIREVKPKNLLLSYGTWKCKKGGIYELSNFIESLWKEKYRPNILLDSGAFTFYRQGIDISLEYFRYGIEDTLERELTIEELGDKYLECLYSGAIDIYEESGNVMLDYINFIYRNNKYIDYVVALDDFNDSQVSFDNYKFFKKIGIKSIPTYHINDDISVLDKYIKEGADYIGLGGIVPVKLQGGKGVYKKIIDWVNNVVTKYPSTKFHLFGTQDPNILDKISSNLYSADGTAWIQNAACNYDRSKKGNKTKLAIKNIKLKDVV